MPTLRLRVTLICLFWAGRATVWMIIRRNFSCRIRLRRCWRCRISANHIAENRFVVLIISRLNLSDLRHKNISCVRKRRIHFCSFSHVILSFLVVVDHFMGHSTFVEGFNCVLLVHHTRWARRRGRGQKLRSEINDSVHFFFEVQTTLAEVENDWTPGFWKKWHYFKKRSSCSRNENPKFRVH